MNEKLVFGVLILSFIGTFVFLAKLIYHHFMMFRNKVGKLSGLLGPFVFFFPSQFNEIGQKHWRSSPPTFFALAICGVILVVSAKYLGIGNL